MSNLRTARTLVLAGLCAPAVAGCDDCTEYALSPTTVEPAQDCLQVSAPPEQTDGCLSEGVTPAEWETAFSIENGCAEEFVVAGDFAFVPGSQNAGSAMIAPGGSGALIIDNVAVAEVDGAVTRIRFPAKLGETPLAVHVEWEEQ